MKQYWRVWTGANIEHPIDRYTPAERKWSPGKGEACAPPDKFYKQLTEIETHHGTLKWLPRELWQQTPLAIHQAKTKGRLEPSRTWSRLGHSFYLYNRVNRLWACCVSLSCRLAMGTLEGRKLLTTANIYPQWWVFLTVQKEPQRVRVGRKLVHFRLAELGPRSEKRRFQLHFIFDN